MQRGPFYLISYVRYSYLTANGIAILHENFGTYCLSLSSIQPRNTSKNSMFIKNEFKIHAYHSRYYGASKLYEGIYGKEHHISKTLCTHGAIEITDAKKEKLM